MHKGGTLLLYIAQLCVVSEETHSRKLDGLLLSIPSQTKGLSLKKALKSKVTTDCGYALKMIQHLVYEKHA